MPNQNIEKIKKLIKIKLQILAILRRLLVLLKKKEIKRISIRELAEAMARFEGFYREGSLPQRYNNPCALRWSKYQSKQKNGFAVFSTAERGWKGAIYDLSCKCQGRTRTGLGPNSTVKELIWVWAPLADGNNTPQYVEFVCNKLGIKPSYQLKNFVV